MSKNNYDIAARVEALVKYAKETNDYTVQLNGRLRVLEEQRLQEKIINFGKAVSTMDNDINGLRDLVRSRDIKPAKQRGFKRYGWVWVYPDETVSDVFPSVKMAQEHNVGVGALTKIKWEE